VQAHLEDAKTEDTAMRKPTEASADAAFDLSGKLIVIEGTDGAGRTTQINLLKRGWRNWATRAGYWNDALASCRRRNSPGQGREQFGARDPEPFLATDLSTASKMTLFRHCAPGSSF